LIVEEDRYGKERWMGGGTRREDSLEVARPSHWHVEDQGSTNPTPDRSIGKQKRRTVDP